MSNLSHELSPILSHTVPGLPASTVPDSTLPSDPAILSAIMGSNTKRIDKLIKHSPTWRTMADDATLHDICTQLFAQTGDYWLSTAQLIDIGPGSSAGPLHPDAGLWSMLLGLKDGEGAPEVAVNFLVAATPTTVQNGATGVVEGSHKLEMGEVLGDVDAEVWRTPDEEVKAIELEAGDCLLVGGRIWHRGGANKTEDERRRVLSIMVTSCALTPEEASPLYVDRETAEGLGSRARKFFGFEGMRPVIGAGFWRQ
jgi:ectoine hydroxylase-related dioxygenase (phytanoyl-CoA dioxygenase family)